MTNNKLYKYIKNNTSQYGEDGVIEEILKRLNITSGVVVDVGASDGKWFSNTFTLLQRGFDVYAIEKNDNAKKMFELKKEYPNLYPIQIGVTTEKNSPSHINNILKTLGVPNEIDLISIDIDSIDTWVFEDLDRNPKVVVIEIEPRYYPLDMKYHNPKGDRKTNPPQNITGFGPTHKIAKEKGYFLIGHTISNLFYLRNDLIGKINSPELTDVEELTNFNPTYLTPEDKVKWEAHVNSIIDEKKPKVWIDKSANLSRWFFEKNGIIITTEPEKANYFVVRSITPFKDRLDKTIYQSREPPLEPSVVWCYDNFDKFKMVVAYEPDPNKQNQIGYNPINYPNFVSIPQRTPLIRENTTLRNRGIFFAGNTKVRPTGQVAHGAISINHLREKIGNYCLNNFQDSMIIGVGWNGQTTRRSDGWEQEKMDKINNSSTDFVLALENCIMPNYMTEKIWDGFDSDKVVLYLGDPNVDRYIPNNCYIDLRPFYDIATDKFDLNGFGDKIRSTTQDEYDSILSNARKIKPMYLKEKAIYQNALTMKIIDSIKQWHS